MSTKHNILTWSDVDSHKIHSWILEQIEEYSQNRAVVDKKTIRILDWGCGRGRAVLKLLEMGYSAFGVDLEPNILENGYPLLAEKGYDPKAILKSLSESDDFKKGSFDIIMSEQVFEHISDLDIVLKAQAKLTVSRGEGLHVFPAARMVRECHVNMPLVHWLPKNRMRKLWIGTMCLMSKKPSVHWPEVAEKSFWEEVNVYYEYLHNKTVYRDNNQIKRIFQKYGFEANYFIKGITSVKRRYLPDFLKRNGFPDQQVRFKAIRL